MENCEDAKSSDEVMLDTEDRNIGPNAPACVPSLAQPVNCSAESIGGALEKNPSNPVLDAEDDIDREEELDIVCDFLAFALVRHFANSMNLLVHA